MDKPWNARIYWRIKFFKIISWIGGLLVAVAFVTTAYFYFTGKDSSHLRPVPILFAGILAVLSEFYLSRWNYITCKNCKKRIRIKEDWYCLKCDHTQGYERHIALKCKNCKVGTHKWKCEHCRKEFYT